MVSEKLVTRATLLLVDHAAARLSARAALADEFRICGESDDVEEATRLAKVLQPDVCLIGRDVAGRDLASVRGICLAAPACAIVVLAHVPDVEDMLAAIRAVHRGGIFVDPSLAGLIVQDALRKRGEKARPPNVLSDRERQVLGLVARGYSSQEIARQIFVSAKTVETYRARFASKLGLRTRSEVVRFAIQLGLLTPESLEAEEGRSAG